MRMERTVRGVEVSWDGGGLNLVRCVDLRSLYEIDRGTVGKGAGWCVQTTTQTLYERFKNERTKNEGETCRRARRRRWEGNEGRMGANTAQKGSLLLSDTQPRKWPSNNSAGNFIHFFHTHCLVLPPTRHVQARQPSSSDSLHHFIL